LRHAIVIIFSRGVLQPLGIRRFGNGVSQLSPLRPVLGNGDPLIEILRNALTFERVLGHMRLISFLGLVRAALLFISACWPSNCGPSGPVSQFVRMYRALCWDARPIIRRALLMSISISCFVSLIFDFE